MESSKAGERLPWLPRRCKEPMRPPHSDSGGMPVSAANRARHALPGAGAGLAGSRGECQSGLAESTSAILRRRLRDEAIEAVRVDATPASEQDAERTPSWRWVASAIGGDRRLMGLIRSTRRRSNIMGF